jgi:hypothetical protein
MSFRLRKLPAAVCLLLALSGCSVSVDTNAPVALPAPTQGTQAQREEALAAARSHLALIDAHRYQESWQQTGPVLRGTINEFMWTNMLRATRGLGTPTERQVRGGGFSTQVDPGGPLGDYAFVVFQSRSGDATLAEKVVMERDQGTWKIIGYFLRRHTGSSDGN